MLCRLEHIGVETSAQTSAAGDHYVACGLYLAVACKIMFRYLLAVVEDLSYSMGDVV